MRVVLMYSLSRPSKEHLDRLQELGSTLEILPVQNEKEAVAAVREAEVILGHRYLRQCLPHANRLRWVQTSAAGVDRLPLNELAIKDVLLTRSTLDASTVAIHAIALAWSITRAVPEACHLQKQKRWDQNLNFAPIPRKALVLGQGPVGRAISCSLRNQGISAVCAKRHAPAPEENLPCDELLINDAWRTALPHVDWCFLAVNHTPESIHLFDEQALRSLPRHAVLINVGRGETLDTEALLRVIETGHLTGVGLDVTEEEPLPVNHPLWNSPRVILSPHIASHHPNRIQLVEQYFESQLARFIAGEELENVVDLHAAGSLRSRLMD